MKQNDIFEQEFEGQSMRFQLVELMPYQVTIQTVDLTPPVKRSGNLLLAALYKLPFATMIDGEYVTTERGDKWIKRFARYIYNRIIVRNKSLQWLIENDMEQSEAKTLVETLDKELNDWQVGYLLTIVRWAYDGEIDPISETDISRVKNVISSYFTYLADRDKDNSVRIKYDSICFKRIVEGRPVAFLWSLDEVEGALRPWADKIIRFNRWPGDKETK
jgi:hypothetical protein